MKPRSSPISPLSPRSPLQRVSTLALRVSLLGVALQLASSPAYAAAPTLPVTLESNTAEARLGKRLAAVGDVNGDGFADLLATSNGPTNSDGTRSEIISLYSGSSTGLVSPPGWTKTLENLSADLDVAIAAAGDVNNDGFPDFIIGAPNAKNEAGDVNSGQVMLYLGSETGPVDPPALALTITSKGTQTGYTVAGIGDLNGDGFDDIAYGAPFAESSSGEANEGRVFVHLGNASGIETTPSWIGESQQKGAQLGCGLAPAGDVNADGFADMLAGACFYDNPESDEGQARVYYGSATGFASAPDWTADGGTASLYAGAVIAAAGDFNDDGFDDVLISVPSADFQQTDAGIVRLYEGSATGLFTTEAWSYSPYQKQALWATSLFGGIDLTGDGIDDILMGSNAYDVGSSRDAGRVSLFEGVSRRYNAEPLWSLDGEAPTQFFGSAIARVGDVTGDGCGELAISAPGVANPETNEGRIYVYTVDGNDRDGDAFCKGETAYSDCDDNVATTYPGAPETVGNGTDDNCDGQELCYVDGDGDGYYDPAVPAVLSSDITCLSAGLLPASTGPSDCDDSKNNVSPGTAETCDTLDNDCDTEIDEGVTTNFYQDSDGDTYGDPAQVRADCAQPVGFVPDNTDCNDADLTVNPGAAEVPADGFDQDCTLTELCYADEDDDGYRPEVTDTVSSEDLDCDDNGEAIASDPAGDCDDTNDTFNPGVLEVCDGLDNDCNNVLDNGVAVECPTGDFDEDGFSEQAGDCNDQSGEINPGVLETCNSLDDNCNTQVDEGDVCATPTPDTDGGGCACTTESPAQGIPTEGSLLMLALGAVVMGRRRRG